MFNHLRGGDKECVCKLEQTLPVDIHAAYSSLSFSSVFQFRNDKNNGKLEFRILIKAAWNFVVLNLFFFQFGSSTI